MNTHSIVTIEGTINFWRNKDVEMAFSQQEADLLTLGKEARVLSDVYGLMIDSRSAEVSDQDLNHAQRLALVKAGFASDD